MEQPCGPECVSGPLVRLIFEREAHLDRHLPLKHAAFLEIAARIDDLKPPEIFQSFMRALKGCRNGLLDRDGGGASEFDVFVDLVFHDWKARKRVGGRMEMGRAHNDATKFGAVSRPEVSRSSHRAVLWNTGRFREPPA